MSTFVLTYLVGHTSAVQSLMRSITVLVIACPCALGLATPLAITAALGSASRNGILIHDSRILETLRKIDTVILDKTGTVTEGVFSLLELVPCKTECSERLLVGAVANAGDDHRTQISAASAEAEECISFMASLEQYSEHPLAAAVMKYAHQEGTAIRNAHAVEIQKSSGLSGIVEGHVVFAGNRRLVQNAGISMAPDFEHDVEVWESQGKTVCFVGWDNR